MKHWIVAFRLRTLPLALACILMGTFLSVFEGVFDGITCALTIGTTVLLQILSNLANDYGDTQNGADSVDRIGPDRAVQTGVITPKQMKVAIAIFGALSFGCGIGLICYVFGFGSKLFYIFLGIGIGAIIAAITYTAGKKPYGYAGLGDLSVLIFFGFVAVLGTVFLYTGKYNPLHLFPAWASGMFATAVLNLNNMRDRESDYKAGKKSIPVRLGRDKAKYYHLFIMLSGIFAAIVFILISKLSIVGMIVAFLGVPLMIINIVWMIKVQEAKDYDPLLKKMALSTLLFTILYGIGLIL